jgi:8-oxo-dGTP diphosphatase
MTKTWMTDDEYKFVTNKTPVPCIDLVILRGNITHREVLLLVRRTGYEKGKWCIIGGRVWIRETIDKAIASYLGIQVAIIQPYAPGFPVWINGNPAQDKTKHSMTSVYPVTIAGGILLEKGEEFSGIRWFPVNDLPENIAYDHRQEITEALHRL